MFEFKQLAPKPKVTFPKGHETAPCFACWHKGSFHKTTPILGEPSESV
jgi:hypothetical protein